MIRHPAPHDLLLDYATGALAEGPSLAVATHLAMCPQSRAVVAAFERFGGGLLEAETPAVMAPDALDRVMARLDDAQRLGSSQPMHINLPADVAALPAVLRSQVPVGMHWRRTIIGLDEILLPLSSKRHEARLLRIEPGRGIPRHLHEGIEHSVVITGSFHDGLDEYTAGDMCVAQQLEHTPIATGGQICIALVVLEKPIVLSGPFGRMINPFRFRRFRR